MQTMSGEASAPALWTPKCQAKWGPLSCNPSESQGCRAGVQLPFLFVPDRGWDGWMASLTQWTWVWVDSGSWWWTGRPGVLWFMGLQRVGHDQATELNWTEGKFYTMESNSAQMRDPQGQSCLLNFICVLQQIPKWFFNTFKSFAKRTLY